MIRCQRGISQLLRPTPVAAKLMTTKKKKENGIWYGSVTAETPAVVIRVEVKIITTGVWSRTSRSHFAKGLHVNERFQPVVDLLNLSLFHCKCPWFGVFPIGKRANVRETDKLDPQKYIAVASTEAYVLDVVLGLLRYHVPIGRALSDLQMSYLCAKQINCHAVPGPKNVMGQTELLLPRDIHTFTC